MDSPVIKPGYQVCSSSFIVEFIDAKKIGDDDVEEENNWHHTMVQLANAFEMLPNDMDRIEREAVDFNLRIIDRYSRIKRAIVHFRPRQRLTLTLVFKVKKKQEKLLTLAAGIISDCVSKKEDFEHLEVPKELLADLNEAYDDIWRVNMKSMKCKSCKAKLEAPHFIHCLSNMKHNFCLTCTRNYVIMQGSSSEVFCPSGERCLLNGVPWSFWPWEIKAILGYQPDKGQEKEEVTRPRGQQGQARNSDLELLSWRAERF